MISTTRQGAHRPLRDAVSVVVPSMSGPGVVVQALVAIGGRASRLRAAQVPVGASKSFMISGRRSLLYWCLKSLHLAGIQRLVLAGNEKLHLRKADAVLHSAHFEFDDVRFFQDAGLGVHGLPAQTAHLLDETVLFEAGHGISHPSHYRAMICRKTPDNVVFSAFPADPSNPRYQVQVDENGDCVPPLAAPRPVDAPPALALAHPMLIDQGYVELLPAHDFTVDRVADYYLAGGRLAAVRSALPVEFDLSGEYRAAMSAYRLALSADPLDERPWSMLVRPRPGEAAQAADRPTTSSRAVPSLSSSAATSSSASRTDSRRSREPARTSARSTSS